MKENYGRVKTAKQFPNNKKENFNVAIPLLLFAALVCYLTGFLQTYWALSDLHLRSTSLFLANLQSYGNLRGVKSDSNADNRSLAKTSKTGKNNYFPNLSFDFPQTCLNDLEEIVHPADATKTLDVPKFFSGHLTDGSLLSSGQADAFGSHVEINGVKQPTIFVAIASYRDWQCRSTVESIFSRAKFPERIRVAVVDQLDPTADTEIACNNPIEPCSVEPEQALCKYQSQIDVYTMDAEFAVGPVFARHVGHRMYRGEFFVSQSDSHVTYAVDWDENIIDQWKSTGNEMAVLTTYLSDIEGNISKDGYSLTNTRPIMCVTDFERDTRGKHLRHGQQPEGKSPIHGSPQLQPYWAAGFSFSRGHFAMNVPYDQFQPMVFQGEEISIGLRGFTFGYDYYAPEYSVCFHMYAIGKNAAKRKKVPLFWENTNRYQGVGRTSMKRLVGIIKMARKDENPNSWNHTDESNYGLGTVRSPQKFFDTFGIHVEKYTVEHHLCSFVGQGKMHNEFVKYMRDDKLGIDYSKINYRFKDPRPGQP